MAGLQCANYICAGLLLDSHGRWEIGVEHLALTRITAPVGESNSEGRPAVFRTAGQNAEVPRGVRAALLAGALDIALDDGQEEVRGRTLPIGHETDAASDRWE